MNDSQVLEYSRRDALGGFSVTAMMLGCVGSASRPARALVGAAPGLPNLDDPLVNLHGFMKMYGSLEEVDCPWWYTGIIYGQQEKTAPKPLFRFEGCEINRYRPNPNGDGYIQSGRTLTFFRDLETEKMIDTWVNPYTGKTNAVRSNLLGGDDNFLLSVNGLRFKTQIGTVPDKPLRLHWSALGDMIWLIKDRGLAEMPQPWLECSSTFCPIKEFADPNLKRAESLFASSYVAPWLPWMEMGDTPGHVVWHAAGRKLKSVEDLPPEYLARARKDAPQQLDARPRKI
ncbi:MAG: DUF1838 family protein [Rhodospirillaceae bacterium]|nr:DUF1838 family protein [Rhodospirillaceae bacterium]